jgi:putative DNA primase/helicase
VIRKPPNPRTAKPAKAVSPFGPPVPLEPPPPARLHDRSLPGWLGDMARAVAAETETPLELAATIGLAAAATAAQGRFAVPLGPGYVEPVNLYGAAAYPAGGRKTPVLKRMAAPLYAWEADRRAEHVPAHKGWKVAAAVLKARLAAVAARMRSCDATKMAELQAELAELEGRQQPEPHPPRLVGEDVTPEHLATLMSQNDGRLALLSDEGGLFDTFAGRYAVGNLPNLDLLLKAHGVSPCRIDRGSRPPIHMDEPQLTLGILPQPVIVRRLLTDPVFRQRGLTARFFPLFVPPSRLGYRHLNARPVPGEVREAYCRGVADLLAARPDVDVGGRPAPRLIRLDHFAHAVWKEWAAEVERMMQRGGPLETMTDYGGKLAGATARVAGLFHLVSEGASDAHLRPLGPATMALAVDFARVCLSHFQHAMAGADPHGDYEVAKRLWDGVIRGAVEPDERGTVTSRQLWERVRGTYRKVRDVDGGLSLLIDHNYLMEPPGREEGQPGRPSRKFLVNPEAVELEP